MTEAIPPNRPQTLPDYLAILQRRKWLILQCVIIVPLVALIVSVSQSHLYRATADVLLSQQDLASQVSGIQDPAVYQDPVRYAQTQAAMARLPAVAQAAVARAGVHGRATGDLLGHSSVSADQNANLLHFSVDDENQRAAVRLVNAYATAFTNFQNSIATASVERARVQLEKRLGQMRAQHQQDSPLFANLQAKEQQLRTLELLQTANALVHPAASSIQIRPRTKRNAALGVLAGLVLGLAFAFGWEALDRRVHSEEEIDRLLDQPILGRLGRPALDLERTRSLVTMIAPRSAEAEAYRRLRTTLDFANRDPAARTIMVTSAVKREGKSTTVANLAVSLAQSGRRVVLVDLDLRQRTLSSVFGLNGVAGVADVVRGSTDLKSALVRVPVVEEGETQPHHSTANGNTKLQSTLALLPAGLLIPTDPARLAASDELTSLLDRLAQDVDLVLIDAPPLLAVAEAMLLAAKVDGLITISRVDVAPRPAVAELAQTLETLSAAKLGLVITGSSHSPGYGYGPYEHADAPAAVRAPAG